jgi:hypothetical protein
MGFKFCVTSQSYSDHDEAQWDYFIIRLAEDFFGFFVFEAVATWIARRAHVMSSGAFSSTSSGTS